MLRRIVLLIILLFHFVILSFGQAPESFKYQAVVRDNSGNIIADQTVGVQITIRRGSANGTVVYQESFSPSTNVFGLVNLELGNGTLANASLENIDWASGPYFIETAVDGTGGTNYTVLGTSQLMSVPYALYAKTSGNGEGPQGPQGPPGNVGPEGPQGIQGPPGPVYSAGTGIDITNNVISTTATSSCGFSIGQTYQGGIIFYLDASGCHGLMCAPTDQSTELPWYNGSHIDTYAYGNGVGAGDGNSQAIRRWQGVCASCYASELCQDFYTDFYDDWYLPSKYELNLMHQNIGYGNVLGLGNVGNFSPSFYWSSTEYNEPDAWGQDFYYGTQMSGDKSFPAYVRAIRAF